MARADKKTKTGKARKVKDQPPRGPFNLFRELRNSLLTGIVVVTPLTVTAWLVYTFVTFVDAQVKPLIPRVYNPESYLPFAIPGLGLVFAVIVLTMIGALAANFLGRFILGLGERLVNRVPLVGNIYGALKQLLETVVAQSKQSFQEVVLVEYPRKGMYAVGFLTADAKGEVKEKLANATLGEEQFAAVFVPTTPNPTSGFLLFTKRSEVLVLDMSVEEGAKLIISAGLVTPEKLAQLKAQGKPLADPTASGRAAPVDSQANNTTAPGTAKPTLPEPRND